MKNKTATTVKGPAGAIALAAIVALGVLATGCEDENTITQIIGGGGIEASELSFELTWDPVPDPGGTRPDLDIYVTDPLGQTISHSGSGSTPGPTPEGGSVDQDDPGDCGSVATEGETVSWTGLPPEGAYQFGIHYVRECDADPGAAPRPEPTYTLTVFVDGQMFEATQGTAVSNGGFTRIAVGAIAIVNP